MIEQEERFWFLKYTVSFGGKENKFKTRIKAKTKQEATNKMEEFVRSKIEVRINGVDEGFSDGEINDIKEGLDELKNAITKIVGKI
jgi:hypothetical protein